MALVVYCPRCHKVVAGRGLDREQAEWAAEDHEDEHREADECERDDERAEALAA